MAKKILFIIPCYNEESRLPYNDIVCFLEVNSVCICFVNDGSNDNTIDVLQNIKNQFPNQVSIVDLKRNVGKGEAIRQGVLFASPSDYTIICYLDADLATPLDEVVRLTNYINSECEFVFGSRVNRIGSNIKRKLSRHLIGRAIATLISSGILNIPVYDTQCGAKVFSSHLVKEIFSKDFKTNWLFDVEIFQRLIKIKSNIDINIYAKEIPLEIWTDVAGSKITMKHYFRIIRDLFQLYFLKFK